MDLLWRVVGSALRGTREEVSPAGIGALDQRKPYFMVPRGQLTFDAEGIEYPGSAFHSRTPHVPSDESGITIGRGFDISRHSPDTTRRLLEQAGIDQMTIQWALSGAGLRGVSARQYISRSQPVEISPAQQQALFMMTYDMMEGDVRRILQKPDTIQAYGLIEWDTLNPGLRELLVDLRYRGDYTSETRALLHPLLFISDSQGIRTLMSDSSYWVNGRGVPQNRFEMRRDVLAD